MLLNQSCVVQVGNKVVESKTRENQGYEILWDYSQKDSDSPGNLKIQIYNLSKTDTEDFKVNEGYIFQFGFSGQLGVFSTGYVNQIESRIIGTDSVLVLNCVESSLEGFTSVSRSFEINSKADYIIRTVCGDAGLILDNLSLNDNKNYSNGFVAYGKANTIIKKIVDNCNSKMSINGNKINVYSDNNDKKLPLLLTFKSGLLEEPERSTFIQKDNNKKQYDYAVKSLAFNEIKKGDIFKIESESVNTFVKVNNLQVTDYIAVYFVEVI